MPAPYYTPSADRLAAIIDAEIEAEVAAAVADDDDARSARRLARYKVTAARELAWSRDASLAPSLRAAAARRHARTLARIARFHDRVRD